MIMFLLGCALVAYTSWTQPMAQADAAIRQGHLERAVSLYSVSEARFNRLQFAKQLFRPDYERLASNQLWLLYALKRFDDTIEWSDSHRAIPASHFWSGSALFEKARSEPQAVGKIPWIGRAQEEFRKALEIAPDDWDAKFNHEVTTRLLAGLRKQPTKASEPVMQMPEPEIDEPFKRPVRKIG